jgi:GTPase SAR1 family protein
MGGINSNIGRNSQILVVGFERSGKTLLLKKLMELKSPEIEGGTIESTKAFDYIKIKINNNFYDFWELGGGEISRLYWPTFYRNLKFGFVFYLINIFDANTHFNSLKELLLLVNEEELKQANFILIFNVIFDGKNFANNESSWKYALELKEQMLEQLKESPIHDFDLRVGSVLIDVSKIKDKEMKTEELIGLFKMNSY